MRIHTVTNPVESLGSLALRYYGNARMWRAIYDHNEDLLDLHGMSLNHLVVGTHLVIPYMQGHGRMPEVMLPTEGVEE